MKKTKYCVICGDRATGFNYKGLSCESCKVFFHRNCSRIEKLKCRKTGKCLITIRTRKCCSKCRMEKCLRNGMAKKKQNLKYQCPIENVMSNLESIIEDGIKENFDDFQTKTSQLPEILPRRKKVASSLNYYENSIISFIQQTAEDFLVDESRAQVIRIAQNMNDCLLLSDLYFIGTIKFCKHIPAFRRLSLADQFALLKPFCYNLIMIRLSFNVDHDKNGCLILVGSTGQSAVLIPLQVSYHHDQKLCREYLDYFMGLNIELENDSKIRDLLCIQLLFLPRDGISCPEFIRYQYFHYSHLLRRYLEHKYRNLLQADRKFSKLMKLTAQLDSVKEVEKEIVKKHLDSLPQLLAETYDFT